jgi:hypothetical protein
MKTPAGILTKIESALLARDGARKGDEIGYRCTEHNDEKPSASFNTVKAVWKCQGCDASGGWKKLATALGIEIPKGKPGRPKKTDPPRTIRAVYPYEDEAGVLLFEKVRYEPKAFSQRRPDGNGGYTYDLDGVRRVLYRTPDLGSETNSRSPVVFIVEGEKDVERLRDEGLTATCNPEGAGVGKWRPEYSEQLRDRRVVVIPDADDVGRKHAANVAAQLFGVAASVAVLELPGQFGNLGADVTDWLGAGVVNTVDELVRFAEAAEPLQHVSLANVQAVFCQHLVGDEDLVIVVLGVVAANRLQCDPVWIFVVGPPSAGKTERIIAVLGLPDLHLLSDLTVGGLLSGVPQRDHAAGTKGGLLREIGSYGQVVVKDFTTVLSMANEPRNALMAALREIADGRWSRTVGVDGGRKLEWEGKLGVIAGVTEAIDQHHAVTGQLGERFLYYRCPPVNRQEQARRSFENLGRENQMRKALRDVVTEFFSTLKLDDFEIEWEEEEDSRIVNLADLAAWLRSAIFRGGKNYEIELVPDAEAPARLARQLAAIFQGMVAVGTSRPTAWRLLRKVALDCLPKLRRRALKVLLDAEWMNTAAIAVEVNIPTNTMRRTLEDLAAHGIIEREAARAKGENEDGDRRTDRWRLSERARRLFCAIAPKTADGGSEKQNHTRADSSLLFNFESTEEDFFGAVLGEEGGYAQ